MNNLYSNEEACCVANEKTNSMVDELALIKKQINELGATQYAIGSTLFGPYPTGANDSSEPECVLDDIRYIQDKLANMLRDATSIRDRLCN